jgi:hypothetical protein
MIHKVQLAAGMPGPLANCYTLVRMWADHSEEGSSTLVRNTILQEVRRLLREVSIYVLKIYHARPLPTRVAITSPSVATLTFICLLGTVSLVHRSPFSSGVPVPALAAHCSIFRL